VYTRIHILAAAVVGAAAGAAAGYFFARKQLEAKYEALYEAEVTTSKTLTSMFQKTAEYASPVTAAAALGVAPPEGLGNAEVAGRLVQSLGYRGKDSVGPDALTRNRKRPYLLRADEYFESDNNFDQITLTYYQGDDSLADEADQLVEDVDAVVGKANLDCFGQISGDPNVVYVRNEKLRADYEIILDHRTYKELVTGLE